MIDTDYAQIENRVLANTWVGLHERWEDLDHRSIRLALAGPGIVLFRNHKLQDVNWRRTAARNWLRRHEALMDRASPKLVDAMRRAWNGNWFHANRRAMTVTEALAAL